MERSQEEIQAKKLRDRGKRLWKCYRWTLEMYDVLFALQGGVCAVCGNPPREGGMPLVVDHLHFKIRTRRDMTKMWVADVPELDRPGFYAKTKSAAIQLAKEDALPLSVRGLLCPGRHGKAGHGSCNRLIGRIDNIPWLKRVILYLENPPAKETLDKPKEL